MRLPIDDHSFDQFLRDDLRDVSAMYWTPLAVIARAAEWLDDVDAKTVLDIGSGAGKFCVGSALASRARFVGLEHRASLVGAARKLARLFDVEERVMFVHAALDHDLVVEADALYLHNPFGENLFPASEQLDSNVELSDARYLRDVASVEHRLHNAAPGTHLLSYGGFGGAIPNSYQEVRVDSTLPSVLRMWQKRAQV
mgnify:CR=1 FL=1